MPDPLSSFGFEPTRVTSIQSRIRGGSALGGDASSFESLLARATGSSAGAGVLGGATRSTTTGALATGAPAGFPQGFSAGQAVVEAAKKHLGVPYLWGGTDAEHGFDCSGLIQDAYRQIGVEMPKWSRHQATMGVEVPSIDEALPGDVLAFGEPVHHVGLYVGDGKMLHAPYTGEVVKIEEIDRPIATIRRIVEPGTVPEGLASLWPGRAPAATDAGPASAAAQVVAASANTNGPALASDAAAPYRDLFISAGSRHGVDPALLAAVARSESAFNPDAVSPVGAQGLMQFMPATAAEMGVDPWDPRSAIDGAARYLRTSLDQFESVELAVASYNAGRGAVSRYDGIPPFPETQNYVQKVLAAWKGQR
ncbi:MAG: transglycosylase SLT domain-containing protein [Actinomycetota bacterium]